MSPLAPSMAWYINSCTTSTLRVNHIYHWLYLMPRHVVCIFDNASTFLSGKDLNPTIDAFSKKKKLEEENLFPSCHTYNIVYTPILPRTLFFIYYLLTKISTEPYKHISGNFFFSNPNISNILILLMIELSLNSFGIHLILKHSDAKFPRHHQQSHLVGFSIHFFRVVRFIVFFFLHLYLF